MLKHSLETFGAGRSILIDADNRVIAGNGTLEAAIAAGITTVRIVDAPENTLVAVQRSDLEGPRAAAMGLADNRTAELSRWDADTLEEVAAELESSPLAGTLAALGLGDVGTLADTGRLLEKVDQLGVVIRCPDEASQRAILQQLLDQGRNVQALVR